MKLVNEFKEKIKNLKLSAQAQKVFDEELVTIFCFYI